MVIVPGATLQRERWRNGGGWTRVIASGRIDGSPVSGADAWDWRLSIADIEADGPFSAFPGVDRVLVLLEGAGIELGFGDGSRVLLVEPLAGHAFAGERTVECTLVAGPTRDFNLMWRRERMRADLTVVPLDAAARAIALPASLQALHVRSGALLLDGTPVAAGDTVLFEHHAPADLTVLAPGWALLVRGERA